MFPGTNSTIFSSTATGYSKESVSYEVAWLNGTWHQNAFPASVLFDRSKLTTAAGVGIPVDSENSKGCSGGWLLLGYQGNPLEENCYPLRVAWKADSYLC